jgi:ATP-dependent RNA helicase DOB1
LSEEFEGSLVRVLRTLNELLGQLATAAHNIGYPALEHTFKEAMQCVMRDIPFAASLYV